MKPFLSNFALEKSEVLCSIQKIDFVYDESKSINVPIRNYENNNEIFAKIITEIKGEDDGTSNFYHLTTLTDIKNESSDCNVEENIIFMSLMTKTAVKDEENGE